MSAPRRYFGLLINRAAELTETEIASAVFDCALRMSRGRPLDMRDDDEQASATVSQGVFGAIVSRAVAAEYWVAVVAGPRGDVPAVAIIGPVLDEDDFLRKVFAAKAAAEAEPTLDRRQTPETLPGRHLFPALAAVAAERRRQIKELGYDAAHDDDHTQRELTAAAISCLSWGLSVTPPVPWPWSGLTPGFVSYRDCLVKGAALVIAEIERLDRAAGFGTAS